MKKNRPGSSKRSKIASNAAIENRTHAGDVQRSNMESRGMMTRSKTKKKMEDDTAKIRTRQVPARKCAVRVLLINEAEQSSVVGAKRAKIPSRKIESNRQKGKEPKIDRTFSCNICKLILSSKKNLERHLAKHRSTVMRLKCPECKRTCSNKYHYELHFQRWHGNGKPPKAKEISAKVKKWKAKSKRHRCKVCGMRLSTKFNLQRHQVMHQPKVERLKCDECGITCGNKYNYQQHWMRRHRQKPGRKTKTVLEPSKFPYRINATIGK